MYSHGAEGRIVRRMDERELLAVTYLMVDATCEAIAFNVKNGFRILCENTLSTDQQTVLMYYDLISLK